MLRLLFDSPGKLAFYTKIQKMYSVHCRFNIAPIIQHTQTAVKQ